MEHSAKFELVKSYYPDKWGKKAVKNATIKKWITKDEYEEITGETYSK